MRDIPGGTHDLKWNWHSWFPTTITWPHLATGLHSQSFSSHDHVMTFMMVCWKPEVNAFSSGFQHNYAYANHWLFRNHCKKDHKIRLWQAVSIMVVIQGLSIYLYSYCTDSFYLSYLLADQSDILSNNIDTFWHIAGKICRILLRTK